MSFERPIQLQREGIGNINYQGGTSASGTNPPGVTVPFIGFTVGDAQAGTPVAGQSFLRVASLQGQSLVNKQLLVNRAGILLNWDTVGTVNEIRRYNSGGLGGWTFEGGITFQNGDVFQIYIIGENNSIQV